MANARGAANVAGAQAARNWHYGSLVRPEVVTKVVQKSGARVAFHLHRVMTELRALAGADAELLAECIKPEFIASMAAACVDQSIGNSQERNAHLIVQACGTGFGDDDLPDGDETLEFVAQQIGRIYARLPAVDLAGFEDDRPGWINFEPPVPAEGEEEEEPPAVEWADCRWFARAMAEFPSTASDSVKLFTQGVLMYCKQGNVSNNVIQKVTYAIRDEMGFNVYLNSEEIRLAWSMVSAKMNAEKAEVVFRDWENAIGNNSLRLKLLVQQAGWTSMTNYINVANAKEKYVDFDWGRIASLVPEEIENYARAVRQVAGNKYFGYNSDLGDAKSTKYPTLALVAYMLITEVSGDMAMREFKGVNTRIENQGIVSDMVRAYRMKRDENFKTAAVGQQALAAADNFLNLMPKGGDPPEERRLAYRAPAPAAQPAQNNLNAPAGGAAAQNPQGQPPANNNIQP